MIAHCRRIMQQNGKKEGWCTPDQMKECLCRWNDLVFPHWLRHVETCWDSYFQCPLCRTVAVCGTMRQWQKTCRIVIAMGNWDGFCREWKIRPKESIQWYWHILTLNISYWLMMYFAVSPRFKERFYGGSAIDGGLSYTHPTSKFTSLYIVTSQAGDHNGAFSGLEAGTNQAGFWNMCARMLRMSSLYNVVYKRVGNLADAIDFVKQVAGHLPKFSFILCLKLSALNVHRWRMIPTSWKMERPWSMWPSVAMAVLIPWCWAMIGCEVENWPLVGIPTPKHFWRSWSRRWSTQAGRLWLKCLTIDLPSWCSRKSQVQE